MFQNFKSKEYFMFESANLYCSKNHALLSLVLGLLFFFASLKGSLLFPVYPVWSEGSGLDINSHLIEMKWEVIGTQGSVTLEALCLLCLPTSAIP